MNKELEALERLYCAGRLDLNYVSSPKHEEDYDLIENALKDFEWLKSKIDIDFVYRLPTDDRIKLIEILGVKL